MTLGIDPNLTDGQLEIIDGWLRQSSYLYTQPLDYTTYRVRAAVLVRCAIQMITSCAVLNPSTDEIEDLLTRYCSERNIEGTVFTDR